MTEEQCNKPNKKASPKTVKLSHKQCQNSAEGREHFWIILSLSLSYLSQIQHYLFKDPIYSIVFIFLFYLLFFPPFDVALNTHTQHK